MNGGVDVPVLELAGLRKKSSAGSTSRCGRASGTR
jgi:hypothetical protein